MPSLGKLNWLVYAPQNLTLAPSKLYSDMVLATDPNATIITVAEEASPSSFNASRGTGARGGRGRPANALAARMGNGGARGWAR